MRRRALSGIPLAVCLMLSWAGWGAAPIPLVTTDSPWQFFRGRSEPSGADLTAWRQRDFNDAPWETGTGVFYYGESFKGTLLNDMGGNYTTLYLRRTFVLTNLSELESLAFTAICDDGFVAWINGAKVAESLAPAGEYTHDALAGGGAPEPVQYLPYPLPPWTEYLVPGTNVLAVQIFNATLGSSDLVFDALLSASLKDLDEPVVADAFPPPGSVTNLASVRVTFSEAVQGVDAADLLVNGMPASGLEANGSVCTFTFPQPPVGPVTISWNMTSGISDAASPPNPFNPTGPTAVWTYTLVDLTEPGVVSLHPPANRTVHQLAQVELTFDRPVTGVDAADLRVNGQPASALIPISASSYVFQFASVPPGPARFEWAAAHGIRDLAASPKPFNGIPWALEVDPAQPLPAIRINEILAEASRGYLDEDGQPEDWIELFNAGPTAVNLEGWSLTDDPALPGQWVFPSTVLDPGQYLVVFASGKNRRPSPGTTPLHTNFKLSLTGEYLGLYNAESPRTEVSELAPAYPEQRVDHSYGVGSNNEPRYFSLPTPGSANSRSTVSGLVSPVHFSVQRGVFRQPFQLSLATATPGAEIRYTLDGAVPTASTGLVYTGPLDVQNTLAIRAAAFKPGLLPSHVESQSYVFMYRAQPRLPILSLTTDRTNLFGPTGIMETNPRNTTQYGLAWERPVSAEWINLDGSDGFQIDAGLRVHGGGYIRGLYDPNGALPYSKYSYRLYFRGDYGKGHLDYPLFPGSAVTAFDSIVLRAGMNDVSNPFLRDEFARRLLADTGQVSSHGTFCDLYVNGVHKGRYNPAEHIGENFLQSWHGGTDDYDLLATFSQVNEGDGVAWAALREFINQNDPALPANFEEARRRLDLVNFIDYLLVNIYADTDDWPHNNWRAARQRTPGSPFRFYMWDAEWSFGYSHGVSWNTITGQLSSLSPPWGSTEIAQLFLRLSLSPEFRLLFADRAHRHFFNDGALTDPRIRARYEQTRAEIKPAIGGFDDSIGTVWIPQRRNYVLSHLLGSGLLASTEAPVITPPGGPLPADASATLQTSATGATVYYTTDGEDPRLRHTGAVSPTATALTSGQAVPIPHDLTLRARTLNHGTWSALTEARFTIGTDGSPLRISEIMYNPPGGDAYEFLELLNPSANDLDLSDWQLAGVTLVFPKGTRIGPGQRLLLASNLNPAAFASRYPGVTVHAFFTGNLPNSGGRLALLDARQRTVLSVDYDDEGGWPNSADGAGRSLELVDFAGDPDAPASWRASAGPGGSPGTANLAPPNPAVRLNELLAENAGIVSLANTHPDYIELLNPGTTPANLPGWSITDDGNARKFVFPNGTALPAGGFLMLWCDTPGAAPGLHTGFALGRKGETVSLFDAQTNLVDQITFGLQITNRSVGRINATGRWELTEPSPGGLNEPALLGDPADLVLNELLSNPSPGNPDWVELHNRNPDRPVALNGLQFTTPNTLFQIRSLSFIEPGGYLQLLADEKPGAEHLRFRLPASGGTLALAGPAGQELSQLPFPALGEGEAYGRWPDAVGDFIPLTGAPSPGAPNYQAAYTGAVLNEIMAWNTHAFTNATGQVADWIELRNPGAAQAVLSGMSLVLDNHTPWLFPAGVALRPGEHLLLSCDPDQPASTNTAGPLQLGRGLPREQGTVRLLNPAGQTVDQVHYGFQIEDRSIGRTPEGWSLLDRSTPKQDNTAAAVLGSVTNLCINEWQAGAPGRADWFELHNRDALPVLLTGCAVTDDPSWIGRTNTLAGPLSYIAGGGWVRWIADGDPAQGDHHARFKLDAVGGSLRLYSPAGTTLDSVYYTLQPRTGSQGRSPDGSVLIADFTTTPTPEAANYLPIPGLVINEVLSHTDSPLEDAIEFRNLTGAPIDLGGFYLGHSARDPRQYRIPDGTTVPAQGYHVFYEYQFNANPAASTSFTLNSAHGDTVCLAAADATGRLTGYRRQLDFGAAENSVSLGRFETSIGEVFVPLRRRTFGHDNLEPLGQFRTGAGGPNAYPKVGPIVVTELMYHPVTLGGASLVENELEEFLELFNPTSDPVPLYDPQHPTNRWRLDGGIRFEFPPNVSLPANGRLLLVNFDPATNTAALAHFRDRYQVDPTIPTFGPYEGKLNNAADHIALYKPDRPQEAPHPDAGFVPYLLVEALDYTNGHPWPAGADGQGFSLQRRVTSDFGNDPANWHAAAPTAGRANALPDDTDTDGDGMPDPWEQLHGFDIHNATDADADPDADGQSNRAEYIAGTHPLNPGSHPDLRLVLGADGTLRLGLSVVSGRAYDFHYLTSLDNGAWQWFHTYTATGSGWVELDDPLPPAELRYYRMSIRRLP